MGRPRTPCLLAPLTLYTFQFYASSATGATPYAADGISFVDGMVTSIRVPHGYGNTRGVSKTGNAGTGTVLDFGTPRIPCTRTAVLRVLHGLIM